MRSPPGMHMHISALASLSSLDSVVDRFSAAEPVHELAMDSAAMYDVKRMHQVRCRSRAAVYPPRAPAGGRHLPPQRRFAAPSDDRRRACVLGRRGT